MNGMNTFDPCKEHTNGHFPYCLLCEITQLRKRVRELTVAGRCTECDDPECPGLIRCPRCGVHEHGSAAETHVVDHGYCRECLRTWQWMEGKEQDNAADEQ